MSTLSPSLEAIKPADVLIVLGRGPEDPVRVQHALDIAQVLSKYGQMPTVYFCGGIPWDRKIDQQNEGPALHRTAMTMLDETPHRYRDVDRSRLKMVEGDSTIEQFVLVGEQEEADTFITLTDDLHNRFGRVAFLGRRLFGLEQFTQLVTYPSPHHPWEEVREAGMSIATYLAFRNVRPGDWDGARQAQRNIEQRNIGAILKAR